jgi:hypothetical protein
MALWTRTSHSDIVYVWDVISDLGPFMIFISGSWEVVRDDPVNDGLAIGAI